MGNILNIDKATKKIIQDALDDIITELGKDCRLVYPSKAIACVNCQADPIGHKPSVRWKTGGPMPFSSGSICPLCNGVGKRFEEVYEDIRFKLNWDFKKFLYPFSPNVDVRVPFSIVQVKGYITDMPKIIKADHLIIQLPLESMLKKKFKLIGSPGDASNIIQGRYFISTWEQI